MNAASLAQQITAPIADVASMAAQSGPITVQPAVVNQIAAHLRTMPPHMSPLYNPEKFRTLPRAVQVAVHAAAGQVVGNAPPASAPITMDPDDLDGIHGAEYGGAIDPRTGYLRVPRARLELVGSALLTLSNLVTTGTLKWSPQRDMKATRLVFPTSLVAGSYLQNIMVGNKPIYLGTANEPAENFAELSTAGIVDFPICRVGITISGTLVNAGLAGATNFYTALLGYVVDGKEYEPLRGFMRRLPIPVTNVGAGATATIAINPQDSFKIRKLALDQSIAANFIITTINIGNTPQLLSGDPVPAQAFSDRAQDLWLDFDRCKTGQQIFVTVTNTSAAGANFQGAFLGDIDESSPF